MSFDRVFGWATAYFATFALTSGLFAIAGAASAPAAPGDFLELLFKLSLGLGVAAGLALLVAVGSLVYALGSRLVQDRKDASVDPAEG